MYSIGDVWSTVTCSFCDKVKGQAFGDRRSFLNQIISLLLLQHDI